MTIRVWNFDHGRRSIRAGIVLLMVEPESPNESCVARFDSVTAAIALSSCSAPDADISTQRNAKTNAAFSDVALRLRVGPWSVPGGLRFAEGLDEVVDLSDPVPGRLRTGG